MDQVHDYEKLVSDILAEGMKMCEVLQANVLVEKLPKSWSDYRNSLKHKKRDIPLEELVAHMKIEEANHLKDKVTHSISQLSFKVNLIESGGASGSKFKRTTKKGGQNQARKLKPQKTTNFKRPGKPKPDGRTVKCYVCGLTGHKAYQCQHRGDRQHAPQLNVAENNDDDIIAAVVSEVNLVVNNAEWVVDTGASKHFSATREYFTEFKGGNKGEKMYMGNSSSSEVLGKGKVLLKLTSDFRNTESKGGKHYYITFVDDFSRYTKVYLLRTKDEAENVFLIYKVEVENQLDRRIKRLRSDRVGEYGSNFLKEVCEKNGIIHETSAPYFPQQNDIAERKNRTLKEMMNSLLISSRLTDNMWGMPFYEDPKTYEEAIRSIDSSFWKSAINDELESTKSNHTWELVDLPRGFRTISNKWVFRKVCRLKKSLYGLKQAPKQWYEKFHKTILSFGFVVNGSDACLYSKMFGTDCVIISLYVDDMLIFSPNIESINKTKSFLSTKFEKTDLGEVDVILGVKVTKTEKGFSLGQTHYVEKVLKKFDSYDVIPVRMPYDSSLHLFKNKGSCVSQTEYAKIIRSLMFLMNCTRPDIAYAVSRLSRYTHNPRYYDANWVSDNDEVSSTSGYVFTLGGAAISWKSSKQTCIARSTMESEFLALDLAGQEAACLRNLLAEIPLWGRPTPPVSLLCDSQSAISVAKTQAYNGKKRHIRIRHESVRHLIRNGVLSLEYVRSERNLADPLTKGLSQKLVLDSLRGIGLKPVG
ncbi:hypothetical protein V6N13_061822 [Hibiscus sabdariffa]